jgi:hypothetical protein
MLVDEHAEILMPWLVLSLQIHNYVRSFLGENRAVAREPRPDAKPQSAVLDDFFFVVNPEGLELRPILNASLMNVVHANGVRVLHRMPFCEWGPPQLRQVDLQKAFFLVLPMLCAGAIVLVFGPDVESNQIGEWVSDKVVEYKRKKPQWTAAKAVKPRHFAEWLRGCWSFLSM